LIYLWDVKTKTIKTKHADFSASLSEFNPGSFGLGFESNYSRRGSFNRYGKHFWLSIQLLWVQVFLSADWGNKQQYIESMAKFKRHLELVKD
jgi:hypothetical protein